MARPKANTEDRRRWIAELVKQHGARPAAKRLKAMGVRCSSATALRYFQEHYPGQSADAAAQLDQAAAAAPGPGPELAAPAPPPPPEPDHEMMAADGAEAVLELAMKRAAELTKSTDGRLRLAALDRVRQCAEQLERLRRAGEDRARQRWRVVELRLPPKEAAP